MDAAARRLVSANRSSRILVTALFYAAILFSTGFSAVIPYRAAQAIWNSPSQAGSVLPALSMSFVGVVSLFTGVRWCVLFAMSFTTYRRMQRSEPVAVTTWPFVSVFVPAYNEGSTIEAALDSLRQLDYPSFEVIVVDDGSTDDTFARARRFEGRYGGCAIQVHRKPNGGKWTAHNFAFRHSMGELILCLDADSRVEPAALRRLVARMTDPAVTAVSGQIRVRNRTNLITRLQALEYLMANGAMRMAQAHSGTVLVVPGPIGLFRRSALEEVFLRFGYSTRRLDEGEVLGPFEGDTFAEDFDLSLAILSLGGRIVYEPHAVSHTKSPDWPTALLNQRYRWARGTIQVLRKFLTRARARPDYLHPRLFGWLAGTYGFELILVPLAYFLSLMIAAWHLAAGISLAPLALWACGFFAANFLAAALFTIMHEDRLSVLAALPFYDLYHGFLLNSGWIIALFDEIRGTRMRW